MVAKVSILANTMDGCFCRSNPHNRVELLLVIFLKSLCDVSHRNGKLRHEKMRSLYLSE